MSGLYPEPDGTETGGHSGTDTSHARAVHDQESGKHKERDLTTRIALGNAGYTGLTSGELGALTGMHHGEASGILSNLHRQNRISRLAEKRDGRKVYVTNRDVAGRQTELYGRRPKPTTTHTCPNCGHNFKEQS